MCLVSALGVMLAFGLRAYARACVRACACLHLPTSCLKLSHRSSSFKNKSLVARNPAASSSMTKDANFELRPPADPNPKPDPDPEGG